ncbi:MAG: hypothetical protein V4850_34635 [Myxococcota bacterium]
MPASTPRNSRGKSSEATLGAALVHLLPRLARSRRCPTWPPDLFALAARILERTGAHVHIVNHWPLDAGGREGDWRAEVALNADDWLRRLGPASRNWTRLLFGAERVRVPPPMPVLSWWAELCEAWDTPLAMLRANERPRLLQALMGLLAVSDEVCAGVGFGARNAPFLDLALLVLQLQQDALSVCLEVHPSKARVLPKQHTPQRGMTLRSLSVHLALADDHDLAAVWHQFPGARARSEMHLLLLPWPLKVDASQFVIHKQPNDHRCALPAPYGFFRFCPTIDPAIAAREVDEALERALRTVGHIDAIVLPELALTTTAFDAVQATITARDPGMLLISGVWGRAGADRRLSNHVLVSVPTDGVDGGVFRQRVTQRKHHRWCLDRSQLEQYGLTDALDPGRLWWEHSEAAARELNFITVDDWLTFCPLICEDLARQDPAADVIRAVGPNLVIALLMDGPQLPSRWPGRYASILAEDPGSSVLTLTSLGMSARSVPKEGFVPRNRVIGLWRDAINGEKLLELPEGSDALVLSIAPELREEWTADGRRDGGIASFPVFREMRPVPR